MQNFFKQDKLEIDLFYTRKFFSVSRMFKSGLSYVKDGILFASNSQKEMMPIHFLEREKYIRNCIKNAFHCSKVNENIRLYYKLCRETIYVNDKSDSRNYEYFRIIYQSKNDDLIFDSSGAPCKKIRLLKMGLLFLF